MPGRENNIASEGKGQGFVGARSKVAGGGNDNRVEMYRSRLMT